MIRIISCPLTAAQILLAGSDVGDGLLPVPAKALDRLGKRGEAPTRLRHFRRGELAHPIGCACRNQGLLLTGHFALGWRGLIHQPAEQVLFRDAYVLHAFQNGPAGNGLGRGLLLGHTIQRGQKLIAARVQSLQ